MIMQRIRAFAVACLMWCAMAGAAQAICTDLQDVMALATDGFSDGNRPDDRTFALLGTTIDRTSNDDLLRLLQRSGQAGSFGHLRNFLTELNFIAQSARVQSRQASSFEQDLARATAIVRTACADGARLAAGNSVEIGKRDAEQGIGRLWNQARDVSAAAHERLFADTYKLALLGKLLIAFCALIIGAFACHFLFIILRTIHRGRSICDVSATVEFLAQAAPARITIIGKLGCRIMAQDADAQAAMLAIREGTYCQILVGNKSINARALYDTVNYAGVLFTDPLTRSELRDILSQSRSPAHYDFSFLRNLRARDQVFGLGALPRA